MTLFLWRNFTLTICKELNFADNAATESLPAESGLRHLAALMHLKPNKIVVILAPPIGRFATRVINMPTSPMLWAILHDLHNMVHVLVLHEHGHTVTFVAKLDISPLTASITWTSRVKDVTLPNALLQ